MGDGGRMEKVMVERMEGAFSERGRRVSYREGENIHFIGIGSNTCPCIFTLSPPPLCREACVLVTSVNIHKGDYGSVIVGGRELDLRMPEESIHR